MRGIRKFRRCMTGLLLAAGVQLLVSLLTTQTVHAQRPNIVFILADDLGYGDLSSYGASDLQTPHIDGLVERGMRFDRFYANSPVCSPSRAALLSGRYPDRAGVPGVIRTHAANNWGYLSEDVVLLPSVLKRAGYHTALVGKWHLGLEAPNRPTDRGFDVFHGFLGDMMDDYYHHRRHGINYMRRNEEVIDPEGHASELFTNWAIDYLDERAQSDAPFFLYLAYNAPHTPIQPPEEWIERVQDRQPGMSETRARLTALIEHMDDGIGQVIGALDRNGQAENTLIVFTSDNGGQVDVGADNGPLRGAKQEMFEGGIRVPAAVAWPGRITPGSRSDAIGLTMDFYPTLADAAGLELSHFIDGRSLLPILLGRQDDLDDRPVFFIRREGGTRYMGKTILAVRNGDWKLLQNSPMEPFRLYNLEDDPQEQMDLAQENRDRYGELAALLRQYIQVGGAVPWQKR